MARDRAARPEARPLRLFVAVDVPDDIASRLAEHVAPFRDLVPGARWSNRSGWHITLKFLGATWPRMVDEVRAAVASAADRCAPFETAVTEIGAFPSARRARVVWAGLADPDARFGSMVKVLDDLLAKDFEPERRSLTPHLTLARLNPPRDLSEFAPDLVGTAVASDRFAVDRLILYRSHLSPKGASYEPVMVASMGRPAG